MKRDDKMDQAVRQRARLVDWSRRWGGIAGGALLAALLAALLWYLLSDTAATRREMASAPMLMLPPPPPPPPEPEKLPEPPPDEVVPEVVEPEPAPADKPMDDAPESPAPESAPVTMDSTAQAGTDAFGIQAGRGGGMTGSGAGGGGGLGAGSYGRYVANALQQAFARDARTRLLAFNDIRIDLWLDAEGTATKVVLVQGTGNTRSDELVLDMVREFRADERPPASLRFPARVSIKGRRP